MDLNERLERVRTCLSTGVLITYDIIQAYKVLVLSCGISLEGSCEDLKVKDINQDEYHNLMFAIIITG